jgi:hypothetical protein
MSTVWSFDFRHWLRQQRIWTPSTQQSPKQLIYGRPNHIQDQYWWDVPEDGPTLPDQRPRFESVERSDVQVIDLSRTLWFQTHLPALEFVRNVATSRVDDPLDATLDITRALNVGIEPDSSIIPSSVYTKAEDYRAQMRSFLAELFQTHPSLLTAVIKMCQLSLTQAHYSAYRDAYATELLNAQQDMSAGRQTYSSFWRASDVPENLLEEPSLEFLIRHLEQTDITTTSFNLDNIASCTADGRYADAVIYLPLAQHPLWSNRIAVELSGGPHVQTSPDEAIFVPCNVLHQRNILHERCAYSISILANTVPYSILDDWYFRPLVFTLRELRRLQASTAGSLARVRQNVRPLQIPAARPLFDSSAANPYACSLFDSARA